MIFQSENKSLCGWWVESLYHGLAKLHKCFLYQEVELSSFKWLMNPSVVCGSSQTQDLLPSANAPSSSALHLPFWRQIFHACILVGSPSLEWNTRRKKRKPGGRCSGPWSPCIKPMLATSTITSSRSWKSTVASAKITFPSWKRFLSFCRVSLPQGQKRGVGRRIGKKVNRD